MSTLNSIRKYFCFTVAMLSLFACSVPQKENSIPSDFIRISGTNLLRPDSSKLFIIGTNLGNWLNPEGYMFGFQKASSAHLIDETFRQLVGPEFTNNFWKQFKDNYITADDIRFIASTGANTIRLPFHYKLFTNEDYMGLCDNQDGFARIDSVVKWCKETGLYLILDMHDAPGGQTGDNIDDSYGYPWLLVDEESQKLFCNIWTRIAERYSNETTILGYELCNEPIAHYFSDKDSLNKLLEPLYKRATAAIRKADTNHIILLGGAQWNSIFEPFSDWSFDDKIMYTCHRYGGGTSADAIRSFIDFRDKTGLPMYMGEIGHNTMEWQANFCKTMRENNIGYTFWPYKKIDESCFNGFVRPEYWKTIVDFAEAPRSTYAEIRDARPSQDTARIALTQFLEAVKFKNCIPQTDYIKSLGLSVVTNK